MMNNSLAKRIDWYRDWVIYLALSFLPVIFGIVFLGTVIQASIPDYVPVTSSITSNDVVGYWSYIATFSQVGFTGGYYGPHEFLSPISESRFDVHGPLFPMIYGSIATFTGWAYHTGIYFNAAFIVAGLFTLFALLQLGPFRALLIALVVACFWPLQIYQVVLYQEAFHFSMTLIVAGMFTVLVREPNRFKWPWAVLLFLFLIFLSLIRFSWVLLCVPLFLLLWPRLSVAKSILSIVAGLVVAFAITTFFGLLTPPGVNNILEIMRAFQRSWSSGWGELIRALAKNVLGFLNTVSANNGYNVESLLYGLLILILVSSGAGLLFALRRRLYRTPEREALFHLGNLGLLMVLVFALYLEIGFYRLLGAPLLLSLLVFLLIRPSRLAWIVLGASLLFLPPFIQRFGELRPSYSLSVRQELQHDAAEVSRYIRFDPQVNYWCNTIFLPISLYDRRILTLPPGIGIAWVQDASKIQYPLKSRYLLFDESVDNGGSGNYRDFIRLELIAQLAIGDLYHNLDATCPEL